MGTWVDRIVAIVGLAVAIFTWFGITPSGVAGSLPALVPLAYILAGGLIGWGICRAHYGYGRLPRKPSRDDGLVTYEEFAKSFASLDFDTKSMLKGASLHDAVYYEADEEIGYFEFLKHLDQFFDRCPIRNRITKLTLNDHYKNLLSEHPDLLDDVSLSDLERYAVHGTEGMAPNRFFPHGFNWWYYA